MLVVVLSGVLCWAPNPAGAQVPDCDEPIAPVNRHCYSIADWSAPAPAGFLGGKVTLRSNCMVVPSLANDFITNELWVVSGGWWVEIGITIGAANAGGYYGSPTRFWAENKFTGYFEHYYGIQPSGQEVVATAYASSTNTNDWQLWFDNVQNHFVASNAFQAPAHRLQTGVETENDGSHTYGSNSRMYFYNLGGAITPKWRGSASSTGWAVSDGMYHEWVTYAWWQRSGRGAEC